MARRKSRNKGGKGSKNNPLPEGVRIKNGKVYLKIPRQFRDQAANPVDEADKVTDKPCTPSKSIKPGQAKAAFDRITNLVSASTTNFEAVATSASRQTAVLLERRIETGANWFARNSTPREPGVIVGFDFGTSSSKIAVRDPGGYEDDLAAMEAPQELQSTEHPYLWQAVVWFHPDSLAFSAFPRKEFVALSGFKTGIIGGFGDQPVDKRYQVSRSQAAAAYLALHFAQLFGWLQEAPLFGTHTPDAFLGFSIGIPVAAIDNSQTCKHYKKLVSVAVQLIPSAGNLDLPAIKSALSAASANLPNGFDIVPELAAAIAGYSSQKTARTGAHLLIDVGASTLDMVTFLRVASKKATGIESSVELLGAAALKVAKKAKKPSLEFELACRHQYDVIVKGTRHESRTLTEFKVGREVQIIATGGGRHTPLHRRFINSRATAAPLLGDVPIIYPSPPPAIALKECDTERLLIAYGLTMDVFEKVELLPPSQTPDIPIQPKVQISPTGPEQC